MLGMCAVIEPIEVQLVAKLSFVAELSALVHHHFFQHIVHIERWVFNSIDIIDFSVLPLQQSERHRRSVTFKTG